MIDNIAASPGSRSEFALADLFLKAVDVSQYFSLSNRQNQFQIEKFANASGFNKDITSAIEKATGLLYAGNNQPGNVCFVNNNKDLRDEFKQVFSTSDLISYILGVLKTGAGPKQEYRVPYPADADSFWRLVRSGNEE